MVKKEKRTRKDHPSSYMRNPLFKPALSLIILLVIGTGLLSAVRLGLPNFSLGIIG